MRKCIGPVIMALLLVVLQANTAPADSNDNLKGPTAAESPLEVFIPQPSDILAELDRMGYYDWLGAVTCNRRTHYQDMAVRWLNLGVRCGDGVLAVQAEDYRLVLGVLQVVLLLARDIGVDEPILAGSSDIYTLSIYQRWDEVSRELDAIQEVTSVYVWHLGEEDGLTLMAAGYVLEILRTTAGLLTERYNPIAASIIDKPGLILHLETQIDKLDPKTRLLPVVVLITDKLPEIIKAMEEKSYGIITREAVEQIHLLTTDLILAIERG